MAKDPGAPKERVDIVHKSRTDDQDEGAELPPEELATDEETVADSDPTKANKDKTNKMKVGISMSFSMNTSDTESEDDDISINPKK